MEKLDIIKQAEQLLPEEIRNGSIRMNGVEMPLTTYMETILIGIVKETTTPVYVAEIIKNKFIDKIILASTKEEIELPEEKEIEEIITLPTVEIEYETPVNDETFEKTMPTEEPEGPVIPTEPEEPISYEAQNRELIRQLVESDGFVKTINPGRGQDWSVEEYLYEMALPLMNEEGMVCYAGKTSTLVEFYEKLLQQHRPQVTRADKEHTVLYYLEKVSPDVRASFVEEIGMTVEEYVQTELIDLMVNATDINVNGEIMPVETAIINLAKMQEEKLEAERNRVNENPASLDEIEFTPTGEIKLPEKPLPKLTDEEMKYMAAAYNKGKEITEEEAKKSLNQLMDYIRKVIDLHNLENVITEYDKYIETIPESAKSEYVKAQITKIDGMIAEKKLNIARRNNVIDEYGDVIEGMLNEMSRELKGNEDIDVFSKLNGIATRIMIDMGIVGFQDIQVEANVVRAINNIYFKRLKHDLLIKHQSKDKERLESTIMSFIMDLKQQVFAIQNETRSAAIAGAKIRLDNAYAEVNQFVIDAYESGMINKEERQHYLVEMDAIYAELNPEQVKSK